MVVRPPQRSINSCDSKSARCFLQLLQCVVQQFLVVKALHEFVHGAIAVEACAFGVAIGEFAGQKAGGQNSGVYCVSICSAWLS